jgi:hypothetical protein
MINNIDMEQEFLDLEIKWMNAWKNEDEETGTALTPMNTLWEDEQINRPIILKWLNVPNQLSWLDLGCGMQMVQYNF